MTKTCVFFFFQKWSTLKKLKCLTLVHWTLTDARAAMEQRLRTCSKTQTHKHIHIHTDSVCHTDTHRQSCWLVPLCAGAVTPVMMWERRTGGGAGPSKVPRPSSSVREKGLSRRCRSRRTRAVRCTASWRSTRSAVTRVPAAVVWSRISWAQLESRVISRSHLNEQCFQFHRSAGIRSFRFRSRLVCFVCTHFLFFFFFPSNHRWQETSTLPQERVSSNPMSMVRPASHL